jgi:CheY-like chemotaxis protein
MSSDACQTPVALRVLVVEDEILVALLAEDMLGELGYQVTGPLSRLDLALATAQREPLDLAVLDINVNGDEVYPIAATLRARGIPIIFATGYGKPSVHKAFRDCPTLQKPYQIDDLRAAVAEAMRSGKPVDRG